MHQSIFFGLEGPKLRTTSSGNRVLEKKRDPHSGRPSAGADNPTLTDDKKCSGSTSSGGD